MAEGTRMLQRRATAAVWAVSSYILASGEIGVTTDTNIIKFGDGVNTWTNLDPAFDTLYLPLLGKAADSELLDGVGIESLVKYADTSVLPTNNSFVQRTADGGVKGTDATESTELTTLSQQTSAILESRKILASRTITASATLALTDANKVVYVNHASLTAQVVVTIPLNATVAFPVGTVLEVTAYGAGGAKITPAVGVTLSGDSNAMPGWGTVRLIKSATDAWYGVSMNAGKRFPTIKVRRTTGTENYGTAYVFVAYDTLDATGTYNPDNEWFTIPASTLPVARRIVINKDGEYLFNVNFASQGTSAITYCRLAKMTADNSAAGMQIASVGTTQAVCSMGVRKRVVAGESFGIHHGFVSGSVGKADAEATGGDPNNFMIARIGD